MLGIIVVLVGIANRIGVAWPIMLVLGGMLILIGLRDQGKIDNTVMRRIQTAFGPGD